MDIFRMRLPQLENTFFFGTHGNMKNCSTSKPQQNNRCCVDCGLAGAKSILPPLFINNFIQMQPHLPIIYIVCYNSRVE